MKEKRNKTVFFMFFRHPPYNQPKFGYSTYASKHINYKLTSDYLRGHHNLYGAHIPKCVKKKQTEDRSIIVSGCRNTMRCINVLVEGRRGYCCCRVKGVEDEKTRRRETRFRLKKGDLSVAGC